MAKKIHLREIDPMYGDRVRTITVEEAKELDYQAMVTTFPNGEIARSFDEVLEIIQRYPHEEVEVTRFTPLAGG